MTLNSVKIYVNRMIKQIKLMSLRYRTRKQLLTLDGHLLKDIGLNQQQALQEGKRYFWQGGNSMNEGFSNQPVTEKEHSIKNRGRAWN